MIHVWHESATRLFRMCDMTDAYVQDSCHTQEWTCDEGFMCDMNVLHDFFHECDMTQLHVPKFMSHVRMNMQ